MLKKTAGLALLALILEAIWMLLRVDVLEDLNLFADIRYWPWFVGAVVLHVLIATVEVRIRRPVVRNGWVFGILALALAIGLVVPRLIGGDGLAVGMFQFLNSYWILNLAGYRGLLLVLSGRSTRV